MGHLRFQSQLLYQRVAVCSRCSLVTEMPFFLSDAAIAPRTLCVCQSRARQAGRWLPLPVFSTSPPRLSFVTLGLTFFFRGMVFVAPPTAAFYLLIASFFLGCICRYPALLQSLSEPRSSSRSDDHSIVKIASNKPFLGRLTRTGKPPAPPKGIDSRPESASPENHAALPHSAAGVSCQLYNRTS